MKKWMGMFGLVFSLVAAVSLMPKRDWKDSVGPKAAYADSYQLAVSSYVVYQVAVTTVGWTQVDTPALSGRTNLTIYNMDVSSPVFCRGDNIPAVAAGWNTAGTTLGPAASFPIYQANGTMQSWVNLSLSNFASNRGAYPVSVAMPVYCVSAKWTTNTSTVTVMQSW